MIKGVLPTWLHGRNDKIGTVRSLWSCTNQYKEEHPVFVLLSFCIVYITLQTFAIPGPIVLSILSGAMYPFLKAQILVAFCATTGASCCFILSYLFGKDLFQRLCPSMIDRFEQKVRGVQSVLSSTHHTTQIKQNQDNLLYYLLFLRITPLLPNWFVNIACPLVGVKFRYFFIATLIGTIIIHCNTIDSQRNFFV